MAVDYAFASVPSEVSSCLSATRSSAFDYADDNYTILSSASTAKASNLARDHPLVGMVGTSPEFPIRQLLHLQLAVDVRAIIFNDLLDLIYFISFNQFLIKERENWQNLL